MIRINCEHSVVSVSLAFVVVLSAVAYGQSTLSVDLVDFSGGVSPENFQGSLGDYSALDALVTAPGFPIQSPMFVRTGHVAFPTTAQMRWEVREWSTLDDIYLQHSGEAAGASPLIAREKFLLQRSTETLNGVADKPRFVVPLNSVTIQAASFSHFPAFESEYDSGAYQIGAQLLERTMRIADNCVQCGHKESSGTPLENGDESARLAAEIARLTPEAKRSLCALAESYSTVDIPNNRSISKLIGKFIQLAGGSHKNEESTWRQPTFDFIVNHYHRIRCDGDNILSQEGELLRRVLYKVNTPAIGWLFGARNQHGDGIFITRDGKLRPQFNCVDPIDGKTILEWLQDQEPKFEVQPESWKIVSRYMALLRNAGAKTSSELSNPKICGS